ncbi:MAG: hypothetical protein M1832_004364 [Thelocarpon impressellum]|nr:MAG: hypothetical protein M1832_004364 [Thelocarpon impressellum]
MDLEDMFGNWLAAEEKLSSVAVQPARTVDDVAEDDPYRVILFSDIKDFLAYFPRMEDRYTLLSAFLAFCRLPPLLDSNLDGQPHSSWTDPFVRTEALEQRDRFLGYTPGSAVEGVINPSGAAVEVAAEDPSYPEDRDQQTFGSRCFPAAVDTLFGQEKHWFSAFDAWKETYDTERVPVPLQWLVQALQSLALADAGGAGLAEYYLAFASKNKVSGLRKSAKALLKKYPRSLRLYNAYALIEWRSGNSTVASNIFCTALSMSGTFAEADQHDAILLWRTWIWELLQDGLTFVAWQRLLSVADGRILGESELSSSGNLDGTVKTQPAILLKARRVLEAGRDDALSSKRFDHAIHHTDLLALLTYISSSSSLDAALTIYSTTLTALQGKCPAPSLAIELLHQARARLLHHHTTTSRAFRPAVIRATLAGSIAAFPSNTIFLSLYAAAEARHNLLDRVRDTILSPPSSTSTSLIRHIFSIATAVRALPRGAGYTTNSIAAAFERALVAYPHAPGLWKLYLLFSLRHGQHGPTTLALVHRAITACPWAKGLYLFAFRSDVRAPRRELRAVYNVLGEKELRVHVDLRELLDEGYR